jgi:hypothetical protein
MEVLNTLQFSCGTILIDASPESLDTTPITPVLSTVESLTQTVTANPTDRNAIAALVDAIMEQDGVTLTTAKRRVNKIVRPLLAEKFRIEQRDRVGADTAKAAKIRTAIRRAVGRATQPIDITVIAGDAAPVCRGEDAYHTFKNGGRCQYPGAARRAGYKTEYHRSTLEIIVGAGWVAENC